MRSKLIDINCSCLKLSNDIFKLSWKEKKIYSWGGSPWILDSSMVGALQSIIYVDISPFGIVFVLEDFFGFLVSEPGHQPEGKNAENTLMNPHIIVALYKVTLQLLTGLTNWPCLGDKY